MANTDKKLVMANLVLTGVILVMVAAYVIDFKLPGGKGSGDIFDQLTAKLDAHSELSKYKGAFPTVAKITQADLEFARQNNPEFFKDAKVGDYFLTYPGLILIYDYESGRIVNMVEQEMAPEDLVAKLLAHAELEGYANASVPLITRLDDQTLSAAQANNPAFFGQARSGDYLVDWNDLSVIYDYGNDRIVNFAAKLVIPDDFVQKLMAHAEVAGHSTINPTITKLEQAMIDQGKLSSPDFFMNAGPGQYLLQWQDLYVIYDYDADAVVASFIPAAQI